MTRVVLRGGAAVVCLVAAALLVLLAVDAHAWSTRLPADDLRYRHDVVRHDLWHPRELTPFHLDRDVLAVGDDLAYRKALRAFRLGRALEQLPGTGATTRRVDAQIALEKFMGQAKDAKRRSQAANLIGVLGFAAAVQDVGQQTTFINNAVASFRQAIALDPTNDDALFNLEYALDELKEYEEQQTGSGQRLGQRGAAGTREAGHGY